LHAVSIGKDRTAVLGQVLVPVAASATHVAFSTIRLEPTWMALGQAAGAAAHLAIAQDKQPRNIASDHLQRVLLQQGQVVTYFKDIDRKDPAYAALQYFGTKGFFKDYYARSHAPLDQKTAEEWIEIAKRLGVADVSPPAATVTRGEFCRSLYSRRD
jgi:hypothetical protein